MWHTINRKYRELHNHLNFISSHQASNRVFSLLVPRYCIGLRVYANHITWLNSCHIWTNCYYSLILLKLTLKSSIITKDSSVNLVSLIDISCSNNVVKKWSYFLYLHISSFYTVLFFSLLDTFRSEERRVGKECRSR